MFITPHWALLSEPGSESDALHWTAVEHTLNLPWFYLTLLRVTPTGTRRSMIQVMDPALLCRLIQTRPQHTVIETIKLVSPDYLNESGDWRMEKLVDLTIYHCSAYGTVEAYSVEGNKVYYQPNNYISATDLISKATEKKIIYKEQQHQLTPF
jgi:hypothetical protein